jgi:hypothetical protein
MRVCDLVAGSGSGLRNRTSVLIIVTIHDPVNATAAKVYETFIAAPVVMAKSRSSPHQHAGFKIAE